MLFAALGLMRLTSKTERGLEALREMYLWGILGSVFLVLGLSLINSNNSVGSILLVLGFAVKVPL
jgi:hypothetical protein